MPVGNTDIALFGTVASELLLSGTPMKMTDLYACAWTAGQVSSGSFHNYNNMGVSASDSFVISIWNQSATGASNKGLSNWEGYDHDHNVICSFSLINNTGSPIDASAEIYLDPSAGSTTNLVCTLNMSGGVDDVKMDFDTGLPAYSNFYSGGTFDGYYINVIVIINGGFPNPCYINFSAVDSDFVGAGQVRNTYTDAYGVNSYDMPLNGNMFNDCAAGRDYTVSSLKAVFWNKRTDFRISFDP